MTSRSGSGWRGGAKVTREVTEDSEDGDGDGEPVPRLYLAPFGINFLLWAFLCGRMQGIFWLWTVVTCYWRDVRSNSSLRFVLEWMLMSGVLVAWPLESAFLCLDSVCVEALFGAGDANVGTGAPKFFCVSNGEEDISSQTAVAGYGPLISSSVIFVSALILWLECWALRGSGTICMVCNDLVDFEAILVVWIPPELVGYILSTIFAAWGGSLLEGWAVVHKVHLVLWIFGFSVSFSLCGVLQLL
ncbi:hypothetical protein SUGI_0020110 [Cryptomeria japonica]|nr:hypothetical protein SUGI_0020110 [Cryptomeria japonica]